MDSFYRLPNGCSKHSDCNTCPFDDCKASIRDLNKGKAIKEMRNKVLHLAWNKVSTENITKRTGYSERQVQQIVADGS
jgi:hypothetical protein